MNDAAKPETNPSQIPCLTRTNLANGAHSDSPHLAPSSQNTCSVARKATVEVSRSPAHGKDALKYSCLLIHFSALVTVRRSRCQSDGERPLSAVPRQTDGRTHRRTGSRRAGHRSSFIINQRIRARRPVGRPRGRVAIKNAIVCTTHRNTAGTRHKYCMRLRPPL